jgi:hypothetical protein
MGLVLGLGQGLHRIVIPRSGNDIDAQTFITATGITDANIINAVNILVLSLKTALLWTKFYTIYPIVGGTALTHKYNLKNPLDTDAANRLVFGGGWTHGANGITGNGSTGFARTFLIPSVTLINNNNNHGLYIRTNTTTSGQRDFGVFTGGLAPDIIIGINKTGDSAFDNLNFTTNRITYVTTDSSGLWENDRSTSIVHKAYRNGLQVGTTDTTANVNILPIAEFFIGASNNGSGTGIGFSNKQIAFAYNMTSLSDAEHLTFYNIVQTFQTTLGRQV